MKKFYLFTIILLIVAPLAAEEWTAKGIIAEQTRRHEAKSEYGVEKMTLVDKNGNTEVRKVRKYFKEISDDEGRFLLVFDSPSSVRGTALLTWDKSDGDNDQWMYLPAQKRMQRTAKGSKKGYFMGTDFAFEDMEPEDSDNYDYTIIESTKISGLDCWVIKAVPNNTETAKNSGYKYRNLYILKKLFFTVKIVFYDKQGNKLKTQLNGKLKKINGQRYRTNKAVMTNHKTGHKTIMEIVSREIDQPVDSLMFTERYITSERHIK